MNTLKDEISIVTVCMCVRVDPIFSLELLFDELLGECEKRIEYFTQKHLANFQLIRMEFIIAIRFK